MCYIIKFIVNLVIKIIQRKLSRTPSFFSSVDYGAIDQWCRGQNRLRGWRRGWAGHRRGRRALRVQTPQRFHDAVFLGPISSFTHALAGMRNPIILPMDCNYGSTHAFPFPRPRYFQLTRVTLGGSLSINYICCPLSIRATFFEAIEFARSSGPLWKEFFVVIHLGGFRII